MSGAREFIATSDNSLLPRLSCGALRKGDDAWR